MKKLSRIHQRVNGRSKYEKVARGVPHRDPRIEAATPINVYDKSTEAQDKAFLKGKQGGNCNRTACQKPGAFFLNSGTQRYYCLECAVDIGGFALRTHQDPCDLYPAFVSDMENYKTNYVPTLPAHLSDYLEMHMDWGLRKMADAKEIFDKRGMEVLSTKRILGGALLSTKHMPEETRGI